MNFTSKRVIPWGIFIAGFGMYLFSSAPALGPYRDMGEMVSVTTTLGVAHPPGYPTYTLIGKIFSLIPVANRSYRVNLASVVGGALSGVFLYLLLVQLEVSAAASLFSALLWLAAKGVWVVSIVTEMYSLNLAAAFFLLLLWVKGHGGSFQKKTVYLVVFLAGIFLGIRLDLVLILPALALGAVALLWDEKRRKEIFPVLWVSAIFFLLGFSVYLYLTARSMQKPLLNWSRPETLEKLWGSLSRKSHGGTLDLLSVNYAPGQLFATDMKIYLKDMAAQFRWIGIPLALLGLAGLYKKHKAHCALTVAAWVLCGPFFLYKANLPPNPHALAILEAHFLLPNVIVMLWIGLGLGFLEGKGWLDFNPRKAGGVLLILVFCGLSFANIPARWAEVSKRDNFYAVDYGRNVFNTLPPGSVLIMQKDVQLFTFWALQYAEGKRKDVTVVSRGLAGSPWYIRTREEAGIPIQLGPLREESDFKNFLTANPGRRIFAGWEEDVPFSGAYRQVPYGLVREIEPGSSGPDEKTRKDFTSRTDVLRDIYVYRGTYHYPTQKEFFSSDIIDDYSKSHFARGVEFARVDKDIERARREWSRAIALNPDNAATYYRRGFAFFQEKQYDNALRDFLSAQELFEKTVRLTQEYYSLPDVVSSIRSEWGETLMNLGVTWERLGHPEKSEESYLKALQANPRMAQAHYNLAVLFWNKDWQKVVRHLQETLQIDPSHAPARAFLPKAVYALQKSGGVAP